MDDLKQKAPKLSKIKKENPFRVPDNYFDDFSARLQTKVAAEKQPLPEKAGIITRFLKPALGLAASIAVVFVLVYWPLNEFLDTQIAENRMEQITDNEDEYLSLVESIDEESFYTLLEQSETKEELSDEALIDYLSANFTDFEIYLRTEF
ncbi:MAG: hypothetical protein ACOC1D_00905 [Prolixibacteraceae bacterium]